jgi:hypothetical protein
MIGQIYQHLEGRKSIAREYSYLSKVSAGVYVATSNYKWHIK